MNTRQYEEKPQRSAIKKAMREEAYQKIRLRTVAEQEDKEKVQGENRDLRAEIAKLETRAEIAKLETSAEIAKLETDLSKIKNPPKPKATKKS